MNKLKDTFILSNGYSIPCIGFGTWKIPNDEIAINSIKKAISIGYRHIDTAAFYKNEISIGKGIEASGIPRSNLFITSKVWNTERGYNKTIKAFEKTISNLKTDYLDLYLIHWPASKSQFTDWEKINTETWKAMIALYKSGKIRAIGVSNFKPHHLKALTETEIIPMINQVEFHPGLIQEETSKFCKKHNILLEAWSPLGRGKILVNPELCSIAKKYKKSSSQLCIRWCLQNSVLPLPKSVTPSRIRENFNVFDFSISDEDMAIINSMPYIGGSGLDPDTVDF